MTVQTALLMGTPSLREISTPIQEQEFGSAWLLDLVQDLFDSQAFYGGVGIAAPQIGVNRRLIVFGFEYTERYKNVASVPVTVLCNPEIKIIDPAEDTLYEGCLSLANLRGPVARPKEISYTGFDQFGNSIARTATNFHARLVQHEVDHLNGVLFIDHVKDTRMLGFREELTNAGII